MTSLVRRSLRPCARRPSILQSPTRTTHASSRKTSRSLDPIVAQGSTNHHDLPSFLAYAERVNLSPDRTVYVGTHYEYTVAASLKRYGFDLTRTGRASDLGIDLLGTWTLPVPENAPPRGLPLRVLIQCKATTKTLNPQHVRELEGAFTGAPAQWREGDFLGLLASTQKVSKGVLHALSRSRWPMGFLKVRSDGRVEQFVWNPSARSRGLEGLGVGLRYNEAGGTGLEIVLISQGKPLLHVDQKEEAAALPATEGQLENLIEQATPAPATEEGKPAKKKRGRPKKTRDKDST
ncbi:Endonuclease TnsA /resolvase Hjc/tRNA endonuclease [Macrophomina phaseolina MS6]|uniref:Endonuclease TnsA /resolvase Hjc/tRNA endonuclease n=1 Tax=Macrophomina phaseolina (strain MS6) TaxID=1126212 RepID=K2RI40_MACPH|nr:Endonuclease TnsA /resolvase Hjc/tRNA endonuclease [Macrophomina phaseolina MS6]